NGDTETEEAPIIATVATNSSGTGTYPIEISAAFDPNYSINYKQAELIISPAVLLVKAHNKSKVYGDENPELTYEYQGLVNGDESISTPAEIKTTVNALSGVGIYNIVVEKAVDKNYEISYQNATFDVMPAILTIIATADQEKIYGQEDPVFTYTVTGLKAEDRAAMLSGSLAREKGEIPGSYAIRLGNLSATNNYEVNYVSAEFRISGITVEQIMHPANVSAAWGQYPEMPEMVVVMSQDGRFLEMKVQWNFEQSDIYARGDYPVKGYLENTVGVINANQLYSEIIFTVLPKQAPIDITLSNHTFKGSASEFFLHVGKLTVIDHVDTYHVIELVGNAYDNGYFEIHDHDLYWSSADRVSGRTEFQLSIRVTDRDGNVLDRLVKIERERIPVNDIIIYTTFTPDGDGINDDWGINDLRFYDGVSVSVFERSGKRVFYTENPDKRWDGTFNNIDLAAGTYYYVVEIKELKQTRKGFVTLLKK
ncbi:T9SS C-terminal target domain-containing protein, partial [Anditalea andensis]